MITIEGRNPVLESLRAGQLITDVYLKEGIVIDSKVGEILDMAKKLNVRFKFVSKKYLDNLSQSGIHQGIIALKHEKMSAGLVGQLKNLEEKGVTPNIIYIREAQNEYNVGSIIRSAECSGVNLVILPPKTHISPQMIRSSMGASEHIEVINENLFLAMKIVREWGCRVVGIEVTGKKYYYEEDLTGAIMTIIGGEDKPLSGEVTKKCDAVVKIPLLGKINSLNMSIAASIIMFEKIRQETLNK
jgi:23S rRNA (guanosine2251-2'-O)-methyltransferase